MGPDATRVGLAGEGEPGRVSMGPGGVREGAVCGAEPGRLCLGVVRESPHVRRETLGGG